MRQGQDVVRNLSARVRDLDGLALAGVAFSRRSGARGRRRSACHSGGVIRIIIPHAAAMHGFDISPQPVSLARVALTHLDPIGKGTEREGRTRSAPPFRRVAGFI